LENKLKTQILKTSSDCSSDRTSVDCPVNR